MTKSPKTFYHLQSRNYLFGTRKSFDDFEQPLPYPSSQLEHLNSTALLMKWLYNYFRDVATESEKLKRKKIKKFPEQIPGKILIIDNGDLDATENTSVGKKWVKEVKRCSLQGTSRTMSFHWLTSAEGETGPMTNSVGCFNGDELIQDDFLKGFPLESTRQGPRTRLG